MNATNSQPAPTFAPYVPAYSASKKTATYSIRVVAQALKS